MNCPECGREMEEGEIRAQNRGNLATTWEKVEWYPKTDIGKIFKTNAVSLQLKGKGFYCWKCGKVFAVFERR